MDFARAGGGGGRCSHMPTVVASNPHSCHMHEQSNTYMKYTVAVLRVRVTQESELATPFVPLKTTHIQHTEQH